MVDIITDYMHRVIFADQNANLKMVYGHFVETIGKDITGGFGKCIKLNDNHDKIYILKDNFDLNIIDLTVDRCKNVTVMKIKADIEQITDWAIDDRKATAYFLMMQGSIIICDLKTKEKQTYKIDEKSFLSLVKEERNFTAITINFDSKLLAVSGITISSGKKTNNLLVYNIERDPKGLVKLTLASQVAYENQWEGSTHFNNIDKDYITSINMMNTINGGQVVACFTQCSASASFYLLSKGKLILLQQPQKIHSRTHSFT